VSANQSNTSLDAARVVAWRGFALAAKVEIVSADHQNKPDVGLSIARRWVEEENVSAIVDLPNSGVALAVSGYVKEKHRLHLRELHHRVKNNLHMLVGMHITAERETSSSEARAILKDASQRLMAISAVQQLLHRSNDLRSVRGDEFITTVAEAILATANERPAAGLEVQPAYLTNDMALRSH
jgi:Histidine kinase/Periplasmic binding protein